VSVPENGRCATSSSSELSKWRIVVLFSVHERDLVAVKRLDHRGQNRDDGVVVASAVLNAVHQFDTGAAVEDVEVLQESLEAFAHRVGDGPVVGRFVHFDDVLTGVSRVVEVAVSKRHPFWGTQ
jgi:hypothetical protein